MSASSGSLRYFIAAAALALLLAAVPAEAVVRTVNVSNNQFTPGNLQINPGDIVRWVRLAGSVPHTTTSDFLSPKEWDSGTLQVGVGFEVQFTEADGNGPFPYHCDFHNGMNGTITVASLAVELDDSDVLPTTFSVGQNFPNPFNPTTSIQVSLARSSEVNFSVYNILGEMVDQRNFGQLAPGSYTLTWDANSVQQRTLPSGVYFYRIKADEVVETRKMILLK